MLGEYLLILLFIVAVVIGVCALAVVITFSASCAYTDIRANIRACINTNNLDENRYTNKKEENDNDTL